MAEVLERGVDEGKPFPVGSAGASLMTPLGIVEGEILEYLDHHGTATLERLTWELPWLPDMVTMAVGALIRAGLVRGIQLNLAIVVKPRKPFHAARLPCPTKDSL